MYYKYYIFTDIIKELLNIKNQNKLFKIKSV